MTAGAKAALRSGLSALGLTLADGQVAALLDYMSLIQKWNKVYNLTALRDAEDILTHHLLDSLAVLPALRRQVGPAEARILDVGAGAGLPGVVLAIAEPRWQVDCVDGVAKKAAFIQQAAVTLGLANLRGIHRRVEQIHDAYEVVTSRAFASLADFVQWSEGALAPDGVWLALKGKEPRDEIAQLPPGVAVFHVEQLEVPGLGAERCLVWLRRAVA